MKSILIIITFTLTILSCNSNSKPAKDSNFEIVSPPDFNSNNYDVIGFACGEAGQGTALVDEFTRFIKDKNYKQIRARLYSSKPGEVYLASISCENLAKEGMIELNSTELKQLVNNRGKTDTIHTCSGCTEFENFTVKQLLNDTTNYISTEAERWFDYILEEKIIEE